MKTIKQAVFMLLLTAAVVMSVIGALMFNRLFPKDDVINYDNDNSVYTPSEKNLAIDEQEVKEYYNNMLVVYTIETLSEKQMDKLAKSVGGKIVASASCINEFQIKLKESTLTELNDKIEKLESDERVLYARTDAPMNISFESTDKNPWSDNPETPDSDRGNENEPGGNDWWAEAIGAYTAWEYQDKATPMIIGIVDNGFDEDHEELRGKIKKLIPNLANTPADHGTHVAGLISAADNSVGIRGIADNCTLLCQDIAPSIDSNNFLYTGSQLAVFSRKMIDGGATVVNNSWGILIPSEDAYSTEDDYKIYRDAGITYSQHIESIKKTNKDVARDCVVMMIELLADKKDFIIVQAAGNGYDNGGKGVPAEWNGCFCSITEEVYNSVDILAEIRGLQLTYDDIQKRILIVGAVENKKTDDKYQMKDSSNYGSSVDICAPGLDIFSAVNQNKYAKMSGTSMAAPIVAGSAGYLWSLNPDLSGSEIHDMLINYSTIAVGAGDNVGTEYPMLNIGKAVGLNNMPNAVDYLFSKYDCKELSEKLGVKRVGDAGYLTCSTGDWLMWNWDNEYQSSKLQAYNNQSVTFDGVIIGDNYQESVTKWLSEGWKETNESFYADWKSDLEIEDTMWALYDPQHENEKGSYKWFTGKSLTDSEVKTVSDSFFANIANNKEHVFVKNHNNLTARLWCLEGDSEIKAITIDVYDEGKTSNKYEDGIIINSLEIKGETTNLVAGESPVYTGELYVNGVPIKSIPYLEYELLGQWAEVEYNEQTGKYEYVEEKYNDRVSMFTEIDKFESGKTYAYLWDIIINLNWDYPGVMDMQIDMVEFSSSIKVNGEEPDSRAPYRVEGLGGDFLYYSVSDYGYLIQTVH